MQVDVGQGRHVVELKFTNTPVRAVGNTISLVSAIFMVGLAVKKLLEFRVK